MNPLTQIRNTQKISKAEVAAGYSDSQSWHARYKHSAYIYAGGLPYALTEGDLLAVFSQYGEIIDVNLVRSKDNGKSRGFAFLAYEDQRSTNLAVDNLNGARVGGRIITVDHVDNYRRKIAEIEGREASESGDEAGGEAGQAAAEAAALAAAAADGAQIVSVSEARAGTGGAAGPTGGDEPWAGKSSVYSLLNAQPAPQRSQAAGAGAEEEDPMAAMQRQERLDKEERKRRKQEKKEKKKGKKEKRGRSESGSPPREARGGGSAGAREGHGGARSERRRSRSPLRREERRERDRERDRRR